MKILLDTQDIENLIRETYPNINSVSFNPPKIEVVLETEMINLRKPQSPSGQTFVKEQPPLSMDDKNELEARKGLMASGGKARTLARVF